MYKGFEARFEDEDYLLEFWLEKQRLSQEKVTGGW